MRGEHFGRFANHAVDCGSSPHAWGTQPGPGSRQEPGRFIPTCVGNTLRRSTPGSASVHPHMRGEHNRMANGNPRGDGSSPHAWGTRFVQVIESPGNRFIPTCVGNTGGGLTVMRKTAVHPHMRGEHTLDNSKNRVYRGSSPHAWGTRPGRMEIIGL